MLTVSSLSVSNGVRLSLIKSTCICPACPYIRFAFSPPIFMLITGNVASSRSILLSVVSLFIRLLKPITPSIKTSRRIPAFVSIFFIYDSLLRTALFEALVLHEMPLCRLPMLLSAVHCTSCSHFSLPESTNFSGYVPYQ